MPNMTIGRKFDQIFEIASHPNFLARKGLGNEVPFFIHHYEPADQSAVYDNIAQLEQRLRTTGIVPVMLPIYDIAIQVLKETERLEGSLKMEPRMPKKGGKRSFLGEMKKFVDPYNNKKVVEAIQRRLGDVPDARLAIMYRVGETYPFLRTHDLLNNLHSVITEIPLIVFFPGQYVSSDEHGFYLSLFGKFNGDYYRAFQLEEYVQRGKLNVNAQ
jgi:hypothetical protein